MRVKDATTIVEITRRASVILLATCWAVLGSARITLGAPIAIATYDVTDTPLSRFGCWSHDYTGTIVETGRTVIGCGSDPPVPMANYSGGSGTLNDGVIATSVQNNQLFTITPFDTGAPFQPSITLHLAAPSIVNRIVLHGGDDPFNITPGAIDGVTVEINGTAVAFSTLPSGMANAIGVPVDDVVDLTGSTLADVVTDRIVLRDFTVSYPFPWDETFSITEITLGSVPETTTLALLAIGVAGLGFSRRARQR